MSCNHMEMEDQELALLITEYSEASDELISGCYELDRLLLLEHNAEEILKCLESGENSPALESLISTESLHDIGITDIDNIEASIEGVGTFVKGIGEKVRKAVKQVVETTKKMSRKFSAVEMGVVARFNKQYERTRDFDNPVWKFEAVDYTGLHVHDHRPVRMDIQAYLPSTDADVKKMTMGMASMAMEAMGEFGAETFDVKNSPKVQQFVDIGTPSSPKYYKKQLASKFVKVKPRDKYDEIDPFMASCHELATGWDLAIKLNKEMHHMIQGMVVKTRDWKDEDGPNPRKYVLIMARVVKGASFTVLTMFKDHARTLARVKNGKG